MKCATFTYAKIKKKSMQKYAIFDNYSFKPVAVLLKMLLCTVFNIPC